MIIIRPAMPNDVPFLRKGLRRLASEMEGLAAANPGAGDATLPDAAIEQWLARDHFLVAQGEDGHLRGFLSIYFPFPPPDRALVRPKAGAMILSLFVVPEHRRQGIATWLLDQARATCRTLGAASITLNVAETNVAAQRLYAKLGYQVGSRAMWLDLA